MNRGTGRCVFGVDGGGTRTRARFVELDGRLLWEGNAEGINPNSVSVGLRVERLLALLGEGLAAVGGGPRAVAAGCLGVAGADRAAEKAELEKLLRERLLLGCPLLFTTDADVALVGAHASAEGMILVCGTGSICIGRLADGTRVRAGGYGHFLGDEGSAFFVGFQAIRRSLRSMEGRDERTGMLPALMERFSLDEPDLFVPLVYQRFDKAAIAGASALVEEARATGDPLAVSIFAEAASSLAALVGSVYQRIGSRMTNRALVLQGGLIDHNGWLRAAVREHLYRLHPEMEIREPVDSPVRGACMLAAGLATAPGGGQAGGPAAGRGTA